MVESGGGSPGVVMDGGSPGSVWPGDPEWCFGSGLFN